MNGAPIILSPREVRRLKLKKKSDIKARLERKRGENKCR